MISIGILLAILCWAVTFGVAWGNFWVKIGISVIIITLYALAWKRPRIRITPSSILLGILSAALLYGIFAAGNALAPLILHGASGQVGGIYALGSGNSRWAIALLLLFITGPGEEIFWRGFLQESLMERWGGWPGYVTATLLYGAVHIPSGNIMLILAALVAGAFWGILWLYRRDLTLLIVSHALWGAVIFTIAPIR